jgi:hypothetical protein
MPQGWEKPVQNTRPDPARLRQDLGYVPAKAPAAKGGGGSGGGITITGGNQPEISLTPVHTGQFLGNFTGADASPQGYDFVFTRLNDVPNSYLGQSLKAVRVNAGETALEFYVPSGGGGTAYIPLVAGSEPMVFISDGDGNPMVVI